MNDARDGLLPILRLGAPLYGRHRSQVRQWARTRPSVSYAHLVKEQEVSYGTRRTDTEETLSSYQIALDLSPARVPRR